MLHHLKNEALLVCFVLTLGFSKLFSQDNTADIKFKNGEGFKEAVFSKQNGFWVVNYEPSRTNRTWSYTVHKYAADLSKKEWSLDLPLGMWSSDLVYNAKNPNYVYFKSITPSVFGANLSNAKKELIQISPDGKVVNKEQEKDESLDAPVFFFCDNTSYYEVWTKNKSEDFALLKYDHKTLKRTKLTLNVPKDKNPKGYEEAVLGGITDSTIVLLQYGKKDYEGQIKVAQFNTSDASLTKQFVFKPELGSLKIAPSVNDRYTEGVVHIENIYPSVNYTGLDYKRHSNGQDLDFNRSAYGNIIPASDGNGYFFYALTNYSGKKAVMSRNPQQEGYIIARLDNDGKEVWSKKVQLGEDDVSNMFYKNPAEIGATISSLEILRDENALSLEFNYYNTQMRVGFEKASRVNIGYKYDNKGELLEKCNKDFSIKPRIAKNAKVSVSTTEELLPCYMQTKAKRIIEYIDKKGAKGAYTIFQNKGTFILTTIPDADKKTLKCFYFKN